MPRGRKKAATRGRKPQVSYQSDTTSSDQDATDKETGMGKRTGQLIRDDSHDETPEAWAMRDPGYRPGHSEETGGKDTEESGVEAGESANEDMTVRVLNTGGDVGEESNMSGGGDKNAGGGTQIPVDDGEIWSDAKEDELIDLYRDSPHLWDKETAGFKMRNKKDIAVAEWSVKLGIDKAHVAARIKYLRDVYGRAINPGVSGSAPKKFTARQLHIIKRLSFLAGHLVPRNVTVSTKRRAKGPSATPVTVSPRTRSTSQPANTPPGEKPTQENRSDKSNPAAYNDNVDADTASAINVPNIGRTQDVPYLDDDEENPPFGIDSQAEMSGHEQCDGGGDKRSRSPDTYQNISSSEPKRRKQGKSSKPNDSESVTECEDAAYIHILKDLADAVKRPAPPPPPPPPSKKGGQLQLWADLLISNLSDLPIEMQHEARFNIDSYVLSLRRQIKPYVVSSPKKGVGKSTKNRQSPSSSSTVANAACGSAACGSLEDQQQQQQHHDHHHRPGCDLMESLRVSPSSHSLPLTPTRQHGVPQLGSLHQLQPLQPAHGVSLPRYSPLGSSYIPPGIEKSPNTVCLLSQLMSGAPQNPQYQGHI